MVYIFNIWKYLNQQPYECVANVLTINPQHHLLIWLWSTTIISMFYLNLFGNPNFNDLPFFSQIQMKQIKT